MKSMLRIMLVAAIAPVLFGSAANAGPYLTFGLSFSTDEIGASPSGIDDASDEDVWDTIRSHRPVQADGVTPFTGIQDLRDIGGFAATVGIRYEF